MVVVVVVVVAPQCVSNLVWIEVDWAGLDEGGVGGSAWGSAGGCACESAGESQRERVRDRSRRLVFSFFIL